jgi:hypothetical protein
MAYGDKQDYRPIDIYIRRGDMWVYKVTTTWSHTCKEAKERFLVDHPAYEAAEVLAVEEGRDTMTFDINEWHRKLVSIINGEAVVGFLRCQDGFHMSVQASAQHYCYPRQTAAHPYTTFEVGFPSAVEPTLMPYIEEESAPLDTIYGYVPAEIINEIVIKHGGVKE